MWYYNNRGVVLFNGGEIHVVIGQRLQSVLGMLLCVVVYSAVQYCLRVGS